MNTREGKEGQFKRRKNTAANIQVYMQAKELRKEVTHNSGGLSHLLYGRLIHALRQTAKERSAAIY